MSLRQIRKRTSYDVYNVCAKSEIYFKAIIGIIHIQCNFQKL